MYKKITHTIVEEHFDGADEKMTMPRLRQAVMTEQELRDFTLGYLNTLNDKLNVLVSAVSSPFDTTDIETEIFQMIDDFGNHAKQFYGFEFGESLNSDLRGVAIAYINAVSLAQQNKDTLFIRNRIEGYANDLSNILTTYNNRWLYNDLIEMMRNWLLGYIDQVDALAKKNTLAAESARNSTVNAISSFADAYISGTVDKYPNMFI